MKPGPLGGPPPWGMVSIPSAKPSAAALMSGTLRAGSLRSEGSDAVWGAEPGRAVVAPHRGAEVGVIARAVGSAGHVVEVCAMAVQAGGVIDLVAGQGVDAGDEGRGRAGAADDEPAGREAIRVRCGVVDGQAGIGFGDRRDVGGHPARAEFVVLPGRLYDPGRAT